MAEVWKAFDTQLQRFVAIKLLHANLQADPDFITRFTREAQMVAGLHHPNIVHIYDFHISEGSEAGAPEADTLAYMVMEYVQGRTLATYIAQTSHKKQFPPHVDIIRLFTPISLALDYAHAQGMIHRDIKPANILLDLRHTERNAMGEPILSDFGLAKVLGGAAQTITGSLLGTPLYISPEQVQNRPVSERTDIYSLAVVLYEVCAGVPPFRGESVTGVMMQHLTATPPEPHLVNPNLPPALSRILLKGLAKDPMERYPGAAAMTAAVAEALHVPVPEDLKQAVSWMEEFNSPAARTVLSSSSADIATATSTEETISSPSSADASLAVPPNAEEVASGHDLPSSQPPVKAEAISGPIRLPDSEARLGAQVESAADLSRESAQTPVEKASAPPVVAQPPKPPLQRRRGLIALVALLIVALLGSALGTFFLLTHHSASAPTSAVTNAIVGQAFFTSSGKVDLVSNQGNNDQFQINLHNIPDPRSGTSYYAWLLPDTSQVEAAPILLGKIAVERGVAHFFYGGDSNHSNILATTSRFLITEESASITPGVPSPDLAAWRYYAELPQTPAPGQTYSLLDHLRHLLAKDPTLETLHLHGGLAFWGYSNTQKIQEWAASARDD
jgi:serine/threonine protein kinase